MYYHVLSNKLREVWCIAKDNHIRARTIREPAAGSIAMPCHLVIIIKPTYTIGWLLDWLLGEH
jgi:hypothetical protein